VHTCFLIANYGLKIYIYIYYNMVCFSMSDVCGNSLICWSLIFCQQQDFCKILSDLGISVVYCFWYLVQNAHRWSHFFHLSTATNYTIKWSNIYTTQISDHNHMTRQSYIRYYDRLLWMSYSHVSCTPQKQVTIKQPKSSVKKFTCSYLHCNVTFAASQRHLSNHQNTLV